MMPTLPPQTPRHLPPHGAPPMGAPQAPTPPVAPAPPPEPKALQMSEDDVTLWWARITLARAERKKRSDLWTGLLKGYLPPVQQNSYDINSNVHFRDTHLKIAETWSQMPEWHLTPLEPLHDLRDPKTGQPFMKPDGQPMDPAEIAAHVVAIKREVLNYYMGPDHADADHAILECLFNIFTTSGIGAIKVHYQSDLQPTEVEVPGPPTTMPGAVLGLQPVPGPPVKQTVDVPVYERFRVDAFSPEKLLIPHDWRSTQYDQAPWLGMEFCVPLADAKRQFKLGDDVEANAARDDRVISEDKDALASGATDLVQGVEIWLHASKFDPAVAHSELFYQLVLIEGMDQPAQYRRTPYQTVGPDGRLTADSMIGNPIHPVVLRVLPDHAWPPADAAFTDPLVRIENTWLSQDLKARDANIPRFLHSDAITEVVNKLADVDVGQGVGVPDELMMRGKDQLLVPVPHLENAQSDTTGRAEIRRAREETLGLGSNQAGSVTGKVHSATENAIVQQNVSVRLKSERGELVKSVKRLARKFDSLLQRYCDQRAYVEIVGAQGERILAMWDQQLIAGRYAYDITPDSQLASDPDKRRKDVLDYVNFLAKSPYTNQAEMHRVVDLEFGYDPSRMMQPPPAPPEPKPAVSYSFRGEDMSSPICVAAMLEAGVKLTPELIKQAQQAILAAGQAMLDAPVPGQAEALLAQHQKATAASQPHGGPADKADILSKHSSEQTGELTGPKPGGQLPQAPSRPM